MFILYLLYETALFPIFKNKKTAGTWGILSLSLFSIGKYIVSSYRTFVINLETPGTRKIQNLGDPDY